MSSKKRWQIVVVVAVLVGGVLLFRGRGEGGGDEQGEAAAIETADVKRLVESRLDEATGQSRRLGAFLRRALDELEPPARD